MLKSAYGDFFFRRHCVSVVLRSVPSTLAKFCVVTFIEMGHISATSTSVLNTIVAGTAVV